ncbi:hypothetical protein [Rhizobium sp. CSW-27]|uniref:hypothetical protein n=1 Tax=Rhizobium sp. CSW-27 TaxID=2839985 RepID=UPI001C039316|nr:hypothetical protein [Rhizobium sp. CSW-27]MBT9370082.1 hypothetical protein [Rhizobium sp. CSW-27]
MTAEHRDTKPTATSSLLTELGLKRPEQAEPEARGTEALPDPVAPTRATSEPRHDLAREAAEHEARMTEAQNRATEKPEGLAPGGMPTAAPD